MSKTKIKKGFWGAHFIRFLMFNFVGALLPLLISWSIRRIAGIPPLPGVYAAELLFLPL